MNTQSTQPTLYKSSNYTVPVEVADMFYEILLDDQKQEYVHYCSDIDYLLGLKSVEHLDPAMIKQLSTMQPGQPLPENVTDDDLFRFCKSRYIQEPADCKSYYDILQDCAKSMSEHYQSTVDDYLVNQNAKSIQQNEEPQSQSTLNQSE